MRMKRGWHVVEETRSIINGAETANLNKTRHMNRAEMITWTSKNTRTNTEKVRNRRRLKKIGHPKYLVLNNCGVFPLSSPHYEGKRMRPTTPAAITISYQPTLDQITSPLPKGDHVNIEYHQEFQGNEVNWSRASECVQDERVVRVRSSWTISNAPVDHAVIVDMRSALKEPLRKWRSRRARRRCSR